MRRGEGSPELVGERREGDGGGGEEVGREGGGFLLVVGGYGLQVTGWVDKVDGGFWDGKRQIEAGQQMGGLFEDESERPSYMIPTVRPSARAQSSNTLARKPPGQISALAAGPAFPLPFAGHRGGRSLDAPNEKT